MKRVADVTPGVWLDALPVASNCMLGDADVASSLLYILGVSSCYAGEAPCL